MGAKYTNEVMLPTKGLIYDESLKIPEKVTIRAMTTKEEKMLLGSTNDAVEHIIKACVENPKNLPIDKMVSADVTNLLVDLRILTYGPEYKMYFVCDSCSRKNTISIDLTDLYNRFLPDDFIEPIEIKLPRSGDVLGVKLLRGEDFKAIEKWSRAIEKRTKAVDLKGDITYTLRIAKYIKTIDGKEVNDEAALQYAEQMIGGDSAHFWAVIDGIELGYDVNLVQDCMYCNAENEFLMPVTKEFFRPSA